MDREFRTAFVYVRDSFAGALRETDAGYEFQYDADMHLKNFSLIETSAGDRVIQGAKARGSALTFRPKSVSIFVSSPCPAGADDR
ncbi:MAG: hypothetical protein IKF98_06980, partial [Clostridia bacterium]|nr:hypothetical protein [Clostridia bacterium]